MYTINNSVIYNSIQILYYELSRFLRIKKKKKSRFGKITNLLLQEYCPEFIHSVQIQFKSSNGVRNDDRKARLHLEVHYYGHIHINYSVCYSYNTEYGG